MHRGAKEETGTRWAGMWGSGRRAFLGEGTRRGRKRLGASREQKGALGGADRQGERCEAWCHGDELDVSQCGRHRPMGRSGDRFPSRHTEFEVTEWTCLSLPRGCWNR